MHGNSIYIGDGAGFFAGTTAGASGGAGNNVLVGQNSGNDKMGGNNVYLGASAGKFSNGGGNVFLGAFAGGTTVLESNKLFIDNSNTATPLIWGDFTNDLVKLNGKVGIGNVTTYPTNPLYTNYKLFVTGGILTDEIRVALSASGTWADYVFAKNYNLLPLAEVEAFIAKNKHLPNVPSAAQVKEEGINVGDMARIQQEKIEELTLYIIELSKRIESLEAKKSNN
jgi:hypothetical protein